MTTSLNQVPASSSPGGDSDTEPDGNLIARASELIPLIREHAAQSSEQRAVVEPVMSAIEKAGLFRLFVPRRYSGHGANMCTVMEVIAEVARGDGSTAWTVALLNGCAWIASTFSQQAQDDVFRADARAMVCAILTPATTSERVDGGYVVCGRWPYASGSFAADWAIVGLELDTSGGEDPRGLALIPSSAWTIEPTWFAAGMKGSGSDTIVVEDHFVPEHRVQRFADMLEGRFATPHQSAERNANMAFLPAAAIVLVGPQIGLARHATELTLAGLPEKQVAVTAYNAARNSPSHQLRVAEALTKFDLAELLMQRMCHEIDTAAARHEHLGLLRRGRMRNDIGTIAELVSAGIGSLLTANGAGSFADSNVLSRIWRDAEIAGRHAHVSPDVGREIYGRLLLGADGPPTTDI
ncbi:acyl-CoA dehydrogenase family protein [Pseudonocardia sp. CA-142604]|uniref:acyl-CoA dehydrogenase family protein n=1 Tax=Pseudonocardia sp. CA-142604 TaxID=3240024 RepID=UPI003D8A1670